MKIVVIGAGLAGVSSAFFLARDGHDVVVVERRKTAGLETSYANATLLTCSLSAPLVSPVMVAKFLKTAGSETSSLMLRPRALIETLVWTVRALAHLSAARVRQGTRANLQLGQYNLGLLEQLDSVLPATNYSRKANGLLTVFRNKRSLQGLQRNALELAGFGIKSEMLDAADMVAREPMLQPIQNQLLAGLYCQDDQHGDPYRFCQALEKICRDMGVRFDYGRTVTALISKASVLRAIETDAGLLEPDACVLAAGAYSSKLARTVEINAPIYPVKGYSISVPLLPDSPAPGCPLVDGESHIVLSPIASKLRVAGFAEMAGFSSGITIARVESLKRHCRGIFPDLPLPSPEVDDTAWCGFRPVTPDGLPLIGRIRNSNLFLNTGHGTLGWSHAIASGSCLADAVADRPSPIDVRPFAPDRFNRSRGAA